MIKKILNIKTKSLRKPSREVKSFDKKIRSLIVDMKDTLKAQNDPEGVGLAAPQIGKNLRIFLIGHEGVEKVIINPEVIHVEKKKGMNKSRKSKDILEGCLSLPHFYGPLKRSKSIKIKYLDEEGKTHTEKFTGFMAQIVQHEIDHLNGIIFVDRIIEQGSPLYKFDGEEWEEVELV